MTGNDRHAAVRGADIAFQVDGEGPDLVFGHGLSGSRWADNLLSPIDWSVVPARVLRYDARGHGSSSSGSAPAAYSWEELARDQLALTEQLGISRYLAAGASMGTGTALWAAALAPDRVRGLVLMIPPTAWQTRTAQAALWQDIGDEVEQRGVEVLVNARRLLPLPDPYTGDANRRRLATRTTRAWDAARLAEVLRGAAHADLPSREQVGEISVPTLILAWSGDNAHPVSTAEALSSLIAGSELAIATTRDELTSWSAWIARFTTSLGCAPQPSWPPR